MKQLITLLILIWPISLLSQTIEGVIKDSSLQPIEGVTINLIGTKEKTISSEGGKFKIKIDANHKKLQFKAISYQTFDKQVISSATLLIIMKQKESLLDEVQVIGYGTTTQRYNVGSVTKITEKQINNQAISNPLQALQGRIPGLIVTTSSGLPGSNINIQIRGQNTIKQNLSSLTSESSTPLFIIDGVPFAPQNQNINQMYSVQASNLHPDNGFSPFNTINPNEIASIEVLRDADATAIYGSKGGNGVIIITTKKGKIGKTTFNTNINTGITRIGKLMPMLNTNEYLKMRREAIQNAGAKPNLTLWDPGYAPDLLLFDTTRYTNWPKFFLGNTAKSTNINTSISGGSSMTQFRVNAGFSKNTYIFPGDYADYKGDFMANIHHKSANNNLEINLSLNYSYDFNNSAGNPNLLTAYTLEPNYPNLIDDEGNPIWTYKGITLGYSTRDNPLSYFRDKYNIQSKNTLGHLQMSYRLSQNITLSSNFGYNTYNTNEHYENPKSAQNPIYSTEAYSSFATNNYTTWIIEPQLDYTPIIKNGILKILFGSTFQKNINNKTLTSGEGYINDNLLGSINGAAIKNASDNYSQYKYIALFGRINYIKQNKYILNLNARRDGSSRFGPEKQFGNFGSLAGGWIFTEEKWVKNLTNILNYGKFHISYGITGNDNVGDYQYISRWEPTTDKYDGKLGYGPSNLSNPELNWATTKKLEFGLNLGFLNENILFDATWYQNRSGNQLVNYFLPSLTGFSSIPANLNALVQNTGIELTLHTQNIKTSALTWQSNINLTIPKNKLIQFPNLKTSSYSTYYQIGKSLNSIYGFKYAGVNDKTGIFQFYDKNNQLTISPTPPSTLNFNDYIYIGTKDPKFYGGFQNSISYKNFNLNIFFEFKKQLGINYRNDLYAGLPGMEQNLLAVLVDRWRSPGDISNNQLVTTNYGDAFYAREALINSNSIYSDASFIRLKTVSISYTLNKVNLAPIKAESLRIYCNAQNLFTITNYLGNDPETQSIYGVPVLQTIVFGLQLTF